METINNQGSTLQKVSQHKKRKENRIQSVYSRCLITRKIVLPITTIGKRISNSNNRT